MARSLVLPARRLVVANTLREARSALDRMRGLIGRPLGPGEGLLIFSCRQVHTFGMREPIDVVFCDAGLRVVHVTRGLRPWRISPLRWDAAGVIELRGGAADDLAPGDRLQVRSRKTRWSEGRLVHAGAEGLFREEQPYPRDLLGILLAEEPQCVDAGARAGPVKPDGSSLLQLLEHVLGWVPVDLHRPSV